MRLGIPNDGKVRPFDINRRMVYAFSAMGKGLRGLDIFLMKMKAMLSKSFHACNKALLNVATQNVQRNLELARREGRKTHMVFEDDAGPNEPLYLTVSYDGSWHKRGFTSKYGVGCCKVMITGLVIDFEVLSKYCRSCGFMKDRLKSKSVALRTWIQKHKPKCEKNYDD